MRTLSTTFSMTRRADRSALRSLLDCSEDRGRMTSLQGLDDYSCGGCRKGFPIFAAAQLESAQKFAIRRRQGRPSRLPFDGRPLLQTNGPLAREKTAGHAGFGRRLEGCTSLFSRTQGVICRPTLSGIPSKSCRASRAWGWGAGS
jgi:hypothetical protein